DGAAFDSTKTYNAGEIYNLKATANEGYTFAYWRVNDKIVSYEAELTLRLEATSDVEAIFTSQAASGTVTVSFVNCDGMIVSSVTVDAGSEITLPAYPTKYGYTVDGWNVNGEIIQAGEKITVDTDMIIHIGAYVSEDTYEVSVVGSVNDATVSGKYTYNAKVVVKFDTTSLGDGDFFGGWADANGAVISYEETYAFFVGADVTLSAVIASEAADIKPVVAVTDVAVIENGKKVSFLTERTTPAGYTYVESGVLYTANSELAGNMTLETLAGGIKQKAAAWNTKDGQFRITLASREGTAITAYVRAYLTYLDKNGEYVTIYSDVYSGKTVTENAPDIDTGIEEGEDDF
ncbi:MAG: InlB B-repeat-containing protein, partial [Clostridia bacterium]|nr:InlB B-repeat-containing protein [Clostridia bacterium]